MDYQPNAYDAINTYRAAVAWQSHVPPDTIDAPPLCDVEKMAWGEYHIFGDAEGDSDYQVVALLAVCTYDGGTKMWKVHLERGGVLMVCSKHEAFAVVAKQSRRWVSP